MASQLGATVLANESPPDKDGHVNFLVGAGLIEDAAGHAKGDEAGLLRQEARRIREGYAKKRICKSATALALEPELLE